MANLQVDVASPTSPAFGELYRFSIEVYRSLGDLGLLFPDDRVELLDGLVVMKMNKGPRHVTATHRLVKYLDNHLPAGWCVRQEAPIELPGGPGGVDSVPEPDVAVVSGGLADYTSRHPGPLEVALVIEVASSPAMLARERRGLSRYARAGLPLVWIVNLTDETVEVYTGPISDGPVPHYGTCEVTTVGNDLALVLGGESVAIPVDVILR